MRDIALASMGSGALIIENNKVLLVRLNYGPAKGKFILPGGMVEKDEHPHEACIRELKEETGLTGEVISQISVRHRIETNGRLNIYWVFKCKNLSPAETKLIPQEGEIQEVVFMDIDKALSNDDVRFHTKEFIKIGLNQTVDKIIKFEYPDKIDVVYI